MYNRLKGSKAYLCGQMDRAIDGGVVWRTKITPILSSMGVVILDPADKPIEIGRETAEDRKLRHEKKAIGDFDYVAKEMKLIRQIDLRLVDKSDFLVVCLNMDIFPCGTFEEIFWANRQKKPVLVWIPQGKKNGPDWLFGTIPHQMIYDTVDDLVHYLEYINSSNCVETYGRWVFFDYEDLYLRNINYG